MTLNDVINAAGARISGGDPYMWQCYGSNANYIEFRDTNGAGYAHAIYDTKNYIVYEIHIEVPNTEQCFRWLNPITKHAYYSEAEKRGIDPNNAWDEVGYTHVDTDELILEYLEDIGLGYYNNLPILSSKEPIEEVGEDGRVGVPLELEDDELFNIMKLAHEADMSLNEFVEKILREEILRIQTEEKFVLPMPGTIGSAKLVFPENKEESDMKTFKVNLDIRQVIEVDADSMDEAVKKATHFHETMKHTWGEHNDDISWVDSYPVKQSVEETLSSE
jgi:hypothetical protein